MASRLASRHIRRMDELHFAGYQPARSVHTRSLHALRERLGIRVTDSIVEQGHKAADLLDLVERGELDGCYFASSYLAGRVPALGMFDQPFHAGPRETVFRGLDGEVGAGLGAAVSTATGFRVLGWWDNGIRHISNAVRPIRRVEDCAGLRLRTLDNARHQAAFRRLGFAPVFVDVADLPRAVAAGEVDAQENPLTNMVNFGLHVHHKYVSLTGHLAGIALLLVNRVRYNGLSREFRDRLDHTAREVGTIQREMAVAEDASCLRVLEDAGVAISMSQAIDLTGFQAACSG